MTILERPEHCSEPRDKVPVQRRRVGISTLGCKVNAFESQLIAQKLRQADWEVVDGKESADLYIINTCTVTKEADRQARQLIRRTARSNPDARIVVTGCYAQMSPEECATVPGVDLVVGNDRKLDIDLLLDSLDTEAAGRVLVGDLDQHVSLPDRLLSHCEGHTRAYIQIQQGCDQSCTFCIIHRARGPSRSLSPTSIIRQVQKLLEQGYREFVLCGVDLGSYGEDFVVPGEEPWGLVRLLAELCALRGDFRIRLSSIDPSHIDQRLIDMLATQSRLCPHLHLSLQSGNSLILKRMKRRYDAARVRETVGRLRSSVPGLVLSADIMVGFPTETREQFFDSVRMVRELGIAYPHVFPFSERAGTPASRIPPAKQVPMGERKRRAQLLRAAGKGVRRRLLQSMVGAKVKILVEGGRCGRQGYQRGRAADYVEVWIPEVCGSPGEWAEVTLDCVEGDALIARLAG